MSLEKLADRLMACQQTVSTVESCTGGGIAARCTDFAGSSQWFNGAVVTYSNAMKVRLGVDPADLEQHGAVSESVVRQMAELGRAYCRSDWCISVSGVAGPGGGSEEKPVGTVWIAWAGPESTDAQRYRFDGDRAAVRQQTVTLALSSLLDRIPSDRG